MKFLVCIISGEQISREHPVFPPDFCQAVSSKPACAEIDH